MVSMIVQMRVRVAVGVLTGLRCGHSTTGLTRVAATGLAGAHFEPGVARRQAQLVAPRQRTPEVISEGERLGTITHTRPSKDRRIKKETT